MTFAERAIAAEAASRIAAAKVQIRRFTSNYASTVESLKFVAVFDFRDKLKIYADGICKFDPKFVAKLNPSFLAGSILHEAVHLVEGHLRVGMEMQAEWLTWQVAADLHANQVVAQANLPLPNDVLTPELLEMTPRGNAADYYQILSQNPALTAILRKVVHGNHLS